MLKKSFRSELVERTWSGVILEVYFAECFCNRDRLSIQFAVQIHDAF